MNGIKEVFDYTLYGNEKLSCYLFTPRAAQRTEVRLRMTPVIIATVINSKAFYYWGL